MIFPWRFDRPDSIFPKLRSYPRPGQKS